jgi:hypothetical protein
MYQGHFNHQKMRMKQIISVTASILMLTVLSSGVIAQTKEVLETHFDVVQKFSTIHSKSRSLVLFAQKNLAGGPYLDSAKLMYMDLKASSDGAMARYKSMIDNPSMAKKTGQTVTESINQVSAQLANFQKFCGEKGSTGLGYNPLAAVGTLMTISDLGKGLYSEIKTWQKAKREETKAEIDQYKLLDWDEVK